MRIYVFQCHNKKIGTAGGGVSGIDNRISDTSVEVFKGDCKRVGDL